MTGWLAAAAMLLVAVRTGPAGWWALAALATAVANLASLWLWPFAPCRKCHGTGRNPGSDRKRHGECRRCLGTGRRRRAGASLVHRGAVSLAERRRKAGR